MSPTVQTVLDVTGDELNPVKSNENQLTIGNFHTERIVVMLNHFQCVAYPQERIGRAGQLVDVPDKLDKRGQTSHDEHTQIEHNQIT